MADIEKKAYTEKAHSDSDNVNAYERGEPAVGTIVANDPTRNNDDYYGLNFWGRAGLTPESFKRRHDTDLNRHNKLNATMKGRHLHM